MVMQDETANLFDYEYFSKHGQWPQATQEYLACAQEIGKAMPEKNIPLYIENAYKMHEIETRFFPGRFSPKMKTEGYRKRYLAYYMEFLKERTNAQFFDDQKEVQEKFTALQASIETKFENNKHQWVYSDKLLSYFDEVFKYCFELADKVVNMECTHLFPEPVNHEFKDMVIKQSLNAYTALLDQEGFKKVAEHLGLQTEYIDIDPPAVQSLNCYGCGSNITAPVNSTAMVCEYCGNTLNIQEKGLNCSNCGSTISIKDGDKNSCTSCGANVQTFSF